MEWVKELPQALQAHAPLIIRHKFSGHGLSQLTDAHLGEMGITAVGDRFALLREIDRLRVREERRLFITDQYVPPPGTVPFCARDSAGKPLDGAASTVSGNNPVFESEFGSSSLGASSKDSNNLSLLSNTGRPRSIDIGEALPGVNSSVRLPGRVKLSSDSELLSLRC